MQSVIISSLEVQPAAALFSYLSEHTWLSVLCTNILSFLYTLVRKALNSGDTADSTDPQMEIIYVFIVLMLVVEDSALYSFLNTTPLTSPKLLLIMFVLFM